jgi:hypothetical protein
MHGWHAGLRVAPSRFVGILAQTVGGACHFSQMANGEVGSVPLWKVIVGPQPANCSRTHKGPAFL